MRSSTSLLLIVLMALMGMAAAHQPGSHRAVWIRDGGNVDVDGSGGSLTSTSTATTTQIITQPTGTTDNGDKCAKSVDCASGNCFRGKCQDPLGPGERGCYKDAGCTTGKCNKGKCVPQDAAGVTGDSCNASTQCASGNCSQSQCADQVDVGASCYKNANCASGNCVNGSCIANETVVNGEHCNRSQQCTTGNYCRHGSCSPQREAGNKCYKDQGCVSGSCINTRCA